MAKNKTIVEDSVGTARKGFEQIRGIDRYELELLKERIKRLEKVLAGKKK